MRTGLILLLTVQHWFITVKCVALHFCCTVSQRANKWGPQEQRCLCGVKQAAPLQTTALQTSGRLVLAYGLAHHCWQGSVFTPVCPTAWPAVRCAPLNCQLHCLFDSWFPADPQDFNQTSLNSVQCRLTRSAIYDRATPMMYPIWLCNFNSAPNKSSALHCMIRWYDKIG